MHKKRAFSIVIVLMFFLAACNFPLMGKEEAGEPTIDTAALMSTSVAGTVAALSVPVEPTAEMTLAPETVVEPTAALVVPTVAVAQLPTTQVGGVCNQAYYLTETIEDGTQYYPGESFTKTWTLKNIGTCTWNTNYRLVFESGDRMGGPEYVYLTQEVAPDQEVVLSVDLQPSETQGTYTGYWALEDDLENMFFNGIYVQVEVTKSVFQITGVTTDLKDHSPSSCSPYKLYYTISFTGSSIGKAKYYVKDSEGNTGSMTTVTFEKAGTVDDDQYWEITSTNSYWVKVYIDSPNHQWFGPFRFDVTCP